MTPGDREPAGSPDEKQDDRWWEDYRVLKTDDDGDAVCDNCDEVKPAVVDTELGKRAAVCAECLKGWLRRVVS